MTSEARMYQKMYHILVAAVDMAILDIRNGNYQGADNLLKNALIEAEDVYILWEESEEPAVRRAQAMARNRRERGIMPDMSPEDIERMIWIEQQKN